jgi:hypothetical protein
VKRHLFFLAVFLSLTILIATAAVLRGYASLQEVSIGLLLALALSALLWQKIGRGRKSTAASTENGSWALIWLLVPFSATAAVALVQSIHRGWDIGDTIGASFFALFAGLSIYEFLRRRKKIDSSTSPK